MFRSRGAIIYIVSAVLHIGGAVAVARIERQEVREPTRISIQEVRKAKTPPKVQAPPPPPPPAPEPRKAAKKTAAPAPEPAAEVAPAPAAAPMFDLTLSGGVGVGVSTGGIAVPTQGAKPIASTKPQVTRTAAPKALMPAKPKAEEDSCIEALVKPKPISIPQPTYADRAREAGIQGKVRVELTVDDTGAVVNARVLESLGYGLDEAALEAARASRFEPATRCGKATATTFVIGIRFTI